jgi:hypothetical protein
VVGLDAGAAELPGFDVFAGAGAGFGFGFALLG